MFVKNITLSVDERVLASARRYAVERNTTLNGIVREHLTLLAEKEDRARGARNRIRALSRSSPARTGTKSWSREDLHDR